mgnify:FL=1
MSYLLRWRWTDERWFSGWDVAALFFLTSIIFKRHSITLIEHSIKGKPTFKTTLTKSSRKCSIELPSFNDRRQKSVCLNRIGNSQKSILSGRASAAQQNPTLLILRKSKNNPLRKWWKICSQSKKRALKILFGNKLRWGFCDSAYRILCRKNRLENWKLFRLMI